MQIILEDNFMLLISRCNKFRDALKAFQYKMFYRSILQLEVTHVHVLMK